MNSYCETATATELADPSISRLLSLFPNAAPANITVRVGLPLRTKGASERSTITFANNDTAILQVDFPLCCGEFVRVAHAAGPGEAPAVVVALIPRGRGLAVAVRFTQGVPRWFDRARSQSAPKWPSAFVAAKG